MNKAHFIDYDSKKDRLIVSIKTIEEYDNWQSAPSYSGYILMEGKKIGYKIMARYESFQAHHIIGAD